MFFQDFEQGGGYFQRGQVRFVGEIFEIWNRFSIDFAIEIIILECKNLKIFACGALSDVISVDNFGAGDLIETIYKDNNIYIPLNDENVLSVNTQNKKIIVNPIKGIINYD